MQVLADRLKEIQAQRKCTQKELAEICGITPVTMSAYMKGDKAPAITIVLQMAHNLGVSVGWLCGEEVKQDTPKTYGDVLKQLVDIADKSNILFMPRHGREEVSNLDYQLKTSCAVIVNSGMGDGTIDYYYLETIDKYIGMFWKDWEKARDLFMRDVITEEMYHAIMDNQFEKYSYIPLPSENPYSSPDYPFDDNETEHEE